MSKNPEILDVNAPSSETLESKRNQLNLLDTQRDFQPLQRTAVEK
jgi:hypothetical protein